MSFKNTIVKYGIREYLKSINSDNDCTERSNSCTEKTNSSTNWILLADPIAVCFEDEINIYIGDVPAEYQSIKWSAGDENVTDIIVNPNPEDLKYYF